MTRETLIIKAAPQPIFKNRARQKQARLLSVRQRPLSSGTHGDIIIDGNEWNIAFIHDDLVALGLAEVPLAFERVYTLAHTAASGHGAAWYRRAASEPSHPLKRQDALGNWWEIDEPVLHLSMCGGVPDGATDNAAALIVAEASEYPFIHLGRAGDVYWSTRELYTVSGASSLTKKYYGEGDLICVGVLDAEVIYDKKGPVYESEIRSLTTKSPIPGIEGGWILANGTSITSNGQNETGGGVFERAARAVGASAINMGWPGSNANWDVTADETQVNTIKCLAMTEDDRLAMKALYPGSAYDDGDNVSTFASQMTMDYRIKAQFALHAFRLHCLDHNHNDRKIAFGTLSPPSVAISAVTKGATTTITLANGTTFDAGDRMSLTIDGIPNLNNWSGRVISVAGNDVTINLDTSGYSGSLVTGTAYNHDVSTLCGAFSSIIMYARWCAYNVGVTNLKTILFSAPSEYTGNVFDPYIRPNAKALSLIAAHFGCGFFDLCHALKMDAQHHMTYFEDGTHYESQVNRQVAANLIANHIAGGVARPYHYTEFLPALGVGQTFADGVEARYDRWARGFSTPTRFVPPMASFFTENFASGLGAWTLNGDSPTVVTAPWDNGASAMLCSHGGSATDSYASKASLAFGTAWSAEFKLWLPSVPSSALDGKSVTLLQVRTATNQNYYSLQMIVAEVGTWLRVAYLEEPPDGASLQKLDCRDLYLAEDTLYEVQLEAFGATADYPGRLILTVNGTVISQVVEVNDPTATTPANIRLGMVESSLGIPFQAYFGDVDLGAATVLDFTGRFTGSFTAQSGETVDVVNGVTLQSANTLGGDGVTDDTAALISAFEAGGLVVIPAGRYRIARNGADAGGVYVAWTKSIEVHCHPDAVFVADDLDNDMIRFAVPAAGAGLPDEKLTFKWTGGTFDQRGQRNSTSYPHSATWPGVNPGASATCDGLSVRASYTDGTVKNAASLVEITGAAFIAGDHWQTAGGDSAIYAGDGAEVVSVSGNIFTGSRDVAVYISRDGTGEAGGRAEVENNYFKNCFFGVAFKRGFSNWTARANTFENCVIGAMTNYVTPVDARIEGGIINGNLFDRCSVGVRCDYSQWTEISSNRFVSLGAMEDDGSTTIPIYTPACVLLRGADHTIVCDNVNSGGVAVGYAAASSNFINYDDITVSAVVYNTQYTKVTRNNVNGIRTIAEEKTGVSHYSWYEMNAHNSTGLPGVSNIQAGSTEIRFDEAVNVPNHRNPVLFSDGSASACTIARATQANTGVFFAVNKVAIAAAGSERVTASNTGVGFNAAAPIAKPTITGSRGGNAALAALLTQLSNYGLITDATTA